jgi:N4-gp56 family major capsid protein
MAETVINTTDAITRKRWAKDLFKVLQKAFEFNNLIGTGEDAIIQLRTDLTKGEGDEITFQILLDLVGTGTIGRDTLVGKAESLRFRDFKMQIEKIRKSVDIGIDIDEQRVPFNLMEKGKTGLQNWWAGMLSDYMFHVLSGNSQMFDELPQLGGVPFAQQPVEPDADHLMVVGGATESTLTPADTVTLSFLDSVKQRAEIPTNTDVGFKIRPRIVGGKPTYRVILHNYVFDQLRRNTNVGEWGDMLRAAGKLGDPSVEILYNGMMISKSERVYSRNAIGTGNGRAYRNLFLGAQAAVMGWGGAGDSKSSVMSFHVEKLDHGSKTEVSGGGILGMAKTRFQKNGSSPDHGDYGVITFPSYGAPITG